MKIPGNQVSQEFLKDLLNESEYQDSNFWDNMLVRVYKLPNGHLVLGQTYMDSVNWSLKKAREAVYQDVLNQLRSKVTFLLQDQLYESSESEC